MRILLFFTLVSTCFSNSLLAQDKPAYQIFDGSGKKTTYTAMLDSISNQKEVLLFGEMHDNPIVHWLEFEITQDLAKVKKLVLGAEMVEADNQNQLNAYLDGSINLKKLDSTSRLWMNHKTDYQPLIDFAKETHLKFIATNIPRRYASLVYKEGFEVLDSLSPREKEWIAPLPIIYDPSLPRYQEILKMMGEHGSPKLVMAQAIKDATMAYFIDLNLKKDQLFIHYNGSFHSDFYEGIVWYLKQLKPKLKAITISSVSQKELNILEPAYLNQADFIIVIDENMTKTY